MDASIKYARGTVWLANLPDNFEEGVQGGTRHILIISNNQGNATSPSVIAVPLTSKYKKQLSVNVYWFDTENNKGNTALCSQLRPINKNRLIEYKYTLSDEYMEKVENAIKLSLDIRKREALNSAILNTPIENNTVENILQLLKDENSIRKSYEYMCEILLAVRDCIKDTNKITETNNTEINNREINKESNEVEKAKPLKVRKTKKAEEYIKDILDAPKSIEQKESTESTIDKRRKTNRTSKWTDELIRQFMLDSDTNTSGMSVEEIMAKYSIGTRNSYYTLKSKFKREK